MSTVKVTPRKPYAYVSADGKLVEVMYDPFTENPDGSLRRDALFCIGCSQRFDVRGTDDAERIAIADMVERHKRSCIPVHRRAEQLAKQVPL